jgi:hypothetical protein
VSQKELDLFQLASRSMAEPSKGPTLMRRQRKGVGQEHVTKLARNRLILALLTSLGCWAALRLVNWRLTGES